MEGQERMGQEVYAHELHETALLVDEIDKKGTDHDNLILELHTETILEPGSMPVVVYPRAMSLEEFQHFRSKVEAMSDDEIREEIHKAKENFKRKRKKKPLGLPPSGGIQV